MPNGHGCEEVAVLLPQPHALSIQKPLGGRLVVAKDWGPIVIRFRLMRAVHPASQPVPVAPYGCEHAIDRAGRIVIPRSLREAAALEPGSDVEIRVTNGKLEILASAVVEQRRLARRARLSKRTLKSA